MLRPLGSRRAAALAALAAAAAASRAAGGDATLPAADRRADAALVALRGTPMLRPGLMPLALTPLAYAYAERGITGRFSSAVLRGGPSTQDGSVVFCGGSFGAGFSSDFLWGAAMPAGAGDSAWSFSGGAGGSPLPFLASGARARFIGRERGGRRESAWAADGAIAGEFARRDGRRNPPWRLLVSAAGRSLGLRPGFADIAPPEAVGTLQYVASPPQIGGKAIAMAVSGSRRTDVSDRWIVRIGAEVALPADGGGPATSLRAGTDAKGGGVGLGLRWSALSLDAACGFAGGEAPTFALTVSVHGLRGDLLLPLARASAIEGSAAALGAARRLVLRVAEDAERRRDDLDAFSAFRAAVRLEPKDATSRIRAHAALKRLIEHCALDPDQTAAFSEAAAAFADGRRDDAAARWRAIPGRNPAVEDLARRALALPPRSAAEEIEAAASATPLPADAKGRASSLYQEGLAHYVAGRFTQAAESWKQAYALDPANVDLKRDLERVELKLKALEQKGVRE